MPNAFWARAEDLWDALASRFRLGEKGKIMSCGVLQHALLLIVI